MTLPVNLTEDDGEYVKQRGESVNRTVRKHGPRSLNSEMPKTWKLTDDDVRKAGIQVAANAPEEAAELLEMLGITQHLTGQEKLQVVNTATGFDRRKRGF